MCQRFSLQVVEIGHPVGPTKMKMMMMMMIVMSQDHHQRTKSAAQLAGSKITNCSSSPD